NYLEGNAGNDVVAGGDGDDVLQGDVAKVFGAFRNGAYVAPDDSNRAEVLSYPLLMVPAAGVGIDGRYPYVTASGTHYITVDGAGLHTTDTSANYLIEITDYDNASDGNDLLYGSDGRDTIFGNGGDDYMVGGYGNDILSRGSGNDNLNGDFLTVSALPSCALLASHSKNPATRKAQALTSRPAGKCSAARDCAAHARHRRDNCGQSPIPAPAFPATSRWPCAVAPAAGRTGFSH